MWQRSAGKQHPGVIGGPRLETRERVEAPNNNEAGEMFPCDYCSSRVQ